MTQTHQPKVYIDALSEVSLRPDGTQYRPYDPPYQSTEHSLPVRDCLVAGALLVAVSVLFW